MGYRTARIPKGTVTMWSGTIAAIPHGWALCDGQNGTPDLRDKFVVGARQDSGGVAKTQVTGSLQQSGGSNAHSHTGTTYYGYDYLYYCPGYGNIPAMGGGDYYDGTYGHDHMFTTGVSGNVPPFFALAYIMKV